MQCPNSSTPSSQPIDNEEGIFPGVSLFEDSGRGDRLGMQRSFYPAAAERWYGDWHRGGCSEYRLHVAPAHDLLFERPQRFQDPPPSPAHFFRHRHHEHPVGHHPLLQVSGAMLSSGQRHPALHGAGHRGTSQCCYFPRENHEDKADGTGAGAARLFLCHRHLEWKSKYHISGACHRTLRRLFLCPLFHFQPLCSGGTRFDSYHCGVVVPVLRQLLSVFYGSPDSADHIAAAKDTSFLCLPDMDFHTSPLSSIYQGA